MKFMPLLIRLLLGGWSKERSTKMVLEFSSGKTVPSTRVNSDKTRWKAVAA